jgi:hypothetical protein
MLVILALQEIKVGESQSEISSRQKHEILAKKKKKKAKRTRAVAQVIM